jgi:hypothetical protein
MIMKLRNQPYAQKWEREQKKNININVSNSGFMALND